MPNILRQLTLKLSSKLARPRGLNEDNVSLADSSKAPTEDQTEDQTDTISLADSSKAPVDNVSDTISLTESSKGPISL